MSSTPPPPPPSMPPPGPPGSGGPVPAGPPSFGAQPPQYAYWEVPPEPPRRSGKALAGFILGLASILLFLTIVVPILALVFGLLGARDIKRSGGRKTGMGMARAGWILGLLGLLLGALFILLAAVEASDSTSVRSLEVGDCVLLPDDDADEISRLEDAACTEAHDGEVFATGDLAGGDDDYPGLDQVQEMIYEECAPEFEEYIGTTDELSDLGIYELYPTEETWEDDQGYICLAFSPTGEILTESVEGSAG